MREVGDKIPYLHSLPCFLIFEVQKRNWLTVFSGYLTGNHATDATCDKEDEDEYCCCCLVCLQPTMKFISPLFFCAELHPKYPGCSWTLHKCHLFLGHRSPSGVYMLHQASIKSFGTWLFILARVILWWWCLTCVICFGWIVLVNTNMFNSTYCCLTKSSISQAFVVW